MKPLKCRSWSGRHQSLIPPVVTIAIFTALCLLMQEAAWAGGTVTDCTETSLRAAMAGGGTVTFACDGTITLTNTITISGNTILDGTGHQITISGNGMQVFYVGYHGTVALVNLTVANGITTYGGGAIDIQSGAVCATNCIFANNRAWSGDYPYSGVSCGGAIFNGGSLIADNCQFMQNTAAGSPGEPGGSGGFNGGNGSTAWGGAIYNLGNATIRRSSFISNSVAGGNGGAGGFGKSAGNGGNGGDAYGSAIYNVGTLLLQNSTVAANTTRAGEGGMPGFRLPDYSMGASGRSGSAYGAICGANLVNDTVALNSGGGISNCILANALLASNSLWNCSGAVTDAGHNLSSDASCVLTGVGSMTNTDPKLGPLADNGGPTLTMALLPGSPAIDAGSAVGAPATDQRGVPRPQGHGVDIGAFEYRSGPIFMGMTVQSGTNCQVDWAG